MPQPSVTNEGEVHLDGRSYRIDGHVQRELATRFAPKTVIGDYTDESNPLVSTATWRSWEDGFGLETIRDARDFQRNRWSSLYTRVPGHLLLGPRVRRIGGGLGTSFSRYFDFNDSLFLVEDRRVYAYSDANDSFASLPMRVLANSVSDATTGVLNGENITVVAQGTATDWSADASDTTAWSRDTTPMSRVTFWRDLLWGADSFGKLSFTSDLDGGWTQVADLPEPLDEVVNLFAGPSGDRGDPEALYVATRRGLWVYDNLNERFRNTGLSLPKSNATAAAWNGSVYYTSEQRVFRFTPGPANVIDNVTPPIISDSNTSRTQLGYYKEAHPGIDGIFFLTDGSAVIHQWDGHSWNSFPANGHGVFDAGDDVGGMFLSTSNGKHRLLFGHFEPFVAAGTAAVALPVLSADLAGQSSFGFVPEGHLLTPWFDGFVSGRDKLAVSIGLEVSIPDSNESVRITYTRDNGDTSGTVIEMNEPGYHAITVPIRNEQNEPTGVLFDRISLGVEMNINFTDSTHLLHSPDVRRLSLNYIKAQPIRWAYSFTIDVDAEESAAEVRRSLEQTFEKQSLVRFAYKDAAHGPVEPKLVIPVSLRSEEETGVHEKGRFRLVVTEV